MTAHGLIIAARETQHLASKVSQEKLAYVLTGLSVALVGIMLAREARDLFRKTGKEKEWDDHPQHRKAQHGRA